MADNNHAQLPADTSIDLAGDSRIEESGSVPIRKQSVEKDESQKPPEITTDTSTKQAQPDPKESEPKTESEIRSEVSKLSKQQMVDEIISLKSSISLLIGSIRDTKILCDKYESNNQYLEEYVGTLMKTKK